MGDDLGTGIQNQNLIGDDVANEITSAMGEQMSGSVTPPTVVRPTHNGPPISDEPTEPATQDPPAAAPAPDSTPEPAPTEPPDPPAEPDPPADEPEPEDEPLKSSVESAFDVPANERGSGNTSELFDIKQAALKQLRPLVQHLDQSPEERFETILMMLRSSDDATLVQAAFEAAQAIEDEKRKADALLDVVNEVNYLTRPQSDQK